MEQEISEETRSRGRPRKPEEEKLQNIKLYKQRYYQENIKPYLPESKRGRPKIEKTQEEIDKELEKKREYARMKSAEKREKIKEIKASQQI